MVDRDAGGMDREGVKRLSFEDLEVIEGREAEREVGDVLGADLAGNELLDPFQRARRAAALLTLTLGEAAQL